MGDGVIAAMEQAYSDTKNLLVKDGAVRLEIGGSDVTEKLIAEVGKVYGNMKENNVT